MVQGKGISNHNQNQPPTIFNHCATTTSVVSGFIDSSTNMPSSNHNHHGACPLIVPAESIRRLVAPCIYAAPWSGGNSAKVQWEGSIDDLTSYWRNGDRIWKPTCSDIIWAEAQLSEFKSTVGHKDLPLRQGAAVVHQRRLRYCNGAVTAVS